MISGVLTRNPSFRLDLQPLHLSPRQNSTFLPFGNNTHLPKSPSLSPNGVLSPKSCKFRTKATISEKFVLSETESINMSFYELLGISESDTFVEIKQAYKQLARKYHPDVSPPERTDEYTKRFIRVQEAYETLSDPSRRAMYDRDMSRGLHLAFSARKGYEEGFMERDEWRNQWQGQVAELRKKGTNENSGNNMSWAAQMRRRRFETEMEE